MRSKLRWAAPLVVLTSVVLSFTAMPAQANVSEGYVAGAGTVTDDWGDEGEMSVNQHTISGATGLWQWVLYADGATESNGSAFDEADIDCDFGANTRAATINWQSSHGLSADGVVGENTLSKADNNLQLTSSGDQVRYVGKVHNIWLAYRGSDHVYWVDVPNGEYEGATFKATYSNPGGTIEGHCW